LSPDAWNNIFRLLPLLDAPALQILDLYYSRLLDVDVEWLFNRLLKLKLPLLAMRIDVVFKNADGSDRFFQSPAIQAISLVEVIILLSDQKIQRQRSRMLGTAVMVEHWILGTFCWMKSFT